eukprot:Opistho-1_new@27828
MFCEREREMASHAVVAPNFFIVLFVCAFCPVLHCCAPVSCLNCVQMDVDILITGHTHKCDTFEREGRFFVNPGSATGAYSALTRCVKNNSPLADTQYCGAR